MRDTRRLKYYFFEKLTMIFKKSEHNRKEELQLRIDDLTEKIAYHRNELKHFTNEKERLSKELSLLLQGQLEIEDFN